MNDRTRDKESYALGSGTARAPDLQSALDDLMSALQEPGHSERLAGLTLCPSCGQAFGIENIQQVPVPDRRRNLDENPPGDPRMERRKLMRRTVDRACEKPRKRDQSHFNLVFQCASCSHEWIA